MGKRLYLTEIVILPDSSLVGKTLADAKLGRDQDLKILRLMRGKNRNLIPHATRELQADDVLLVEGSREEIVKITDRTDIDIKGALKLSDPALQTEEIRLIEVILLPRITRGQPIILRLAFAP